MKQLAGTYDIDIRNNYAEYGRTLAWGNRGRNVLFLGNVARFMNDYSYGTEGGENVVFANNISINARSCGIMSMYWGEKLLITGNIVIVRDEPYIQKYSQFKDQSPYWGGMVRFHSGPDPKADVAAGSKYGGGSALVTNNLLINELTDKIRNSGVANSRDVSFVNNKFVNCSLAKAGVGSLTVQGNDFLGQIPKQYKALSVRSAVDVIIRDNVFTYEPKGQGRELKEVDIKGDDEAEAATDEEKLLVDLPAVSVGGQRCFYLRHVIYSGNIIKGWKREAVNLITVPVSKKSTSTDPITIVAERNSIEGNFTILGSPENYRSLMKSNLDLTNTSVLSVIQDSMGPVEKAKLEIEKRREIKRQKALKKKKKSGS